MVEKVTRIAKQINLLALNASVEATRVGEHGKGFTVVTREVQKSSGESSETALEITSKVQQLSEMVYNTIEVLKVLMNLFTVFQESTQEMLSFLIKNNAELVGKTSQIFE